MSCVLLKARRTIVIRWIVLKILNVIEVATSDPCASNFLNANRHSVLVLSQGRIEGVSVPLCQMEQKLSPSPHLPRYSRTLHCTALIN